MKGYGYRGVVSEGRSNERDLTDEEIVQLVRKGSQPAFRELVLRYTPMVYRIALGITSSHQDAEDIVQETFVKAFEKLSVFSPSRGTFKTWLLTITRTQSLDAFRSLKKRWSRFLLGQYPEEQAALFGGSGTHSWFQDAEDLLVSRQEAIKLDSALAKLPKNQRMALILRAQENLSYNEIAEIMGISFSSVDSLIFRARKKLRHFLEEED